MKLLKSGVLLLLLFLVLVSGCRDSAETFNYKMADIPSDLDDDAFYIPPSSDATLANIVGYAAGIINSFIWNRFWTFKVKHKARVQFVRFVGLNIAALALSSASLFVFTDTLELPYLPVWFITMSIVTLVNFVCSKYWVFRVGGAEHCRQGMP